MPTNRISVNGEAQEKMEADSESASTKSGCCYSMRLESSLTDLKYAAFYKALVAEFLGTFILVITSLGSTVQGWAADTLDVVQIALTFGFSVSSAVWALGHISGGNINPAITLALWLTRKMSFIRAFLYIGVQCLGAMSAAGLLKALTPTSQHGSLGATTLNTSVTQGQGFGIEFLITFFLVLTVFATIDPRRKDLAGSYPLSVGLAVIMGHLWAVEFTGSSMNPARSLGPAVAMNIWTDHWVYWVGPLSGGAIAGLLYDLLFACNASLKKASDLFITPDYDDKHYDVVKDEADDTDNNNKQALKTDTTKV